MDGAFIIRFDGGSRGNPGIAGSGYVIYKPNGTLHLCGECFVGYRETNNVAEYTGLVNALKAISMDDSIKKLRIEGDSLLVINQLSGKWKVKAKNLKHLYNLALQLLGKFEYTLSHIPRKFNTEADRLANAAMDSVDNPSLR